VSGGGGVAVVIQPKLPVLFNLETNFHTDRGYVYVGWVTRPHRLATHWNSPVMITLGQANRKRGTTDRLSAPPGFAQPASLTGRVKQKLGNALPQTPLTISPGSMPPIICSRIPLARKDSKSNRPGSTTHKPRPSHSKNGALITCAAPTTATSTTSFHVPRFLRTLLPLLWTRGQWGPWSCFCSRSRR
jgi:hypothetical protein